MLLRLQAEMLAQVEAEFEKAGLPSYRGYEVLVALLYAEGHRLRLSQLANQVGLTRSGLTRMADRLEKDGLLQRGRAAGDGRGVYAQLTEAGQAVVRSAWPTYQACVKHWLEGTVEPDERKFLRHLCTRLLKLPEPAAAEHEIWQ